MFAFKNGRSGRKTHESAIPVVRFCPTSAEARRQSVDDVRVDGPAWDAVSDAREENRSQIIVAFVKTGLTHFFQKNWR